MEVRVADEPYDLREGRFERVAVGRDEDRLQRPVFPGRKGADLAFPGDNQANGTNDVNWLRVSVDPRSREVFAYQAQIVPANRVAVPAP